MKQKAYNRINIDIEKLKELYNEGYPVTQISTIMNVSVYSLRSRIKEYGLKKPKIKKPRLSRVVIDLDEKEIIRLYCEEMLTIQEICKKFNVNYGTIKLRLINNNIKLRNASESKLIYMNRPEVKKKMSKVMTGKNMGEDSHRWKGGYNKRNIPMYDTYAIKISYAEECRRDPKDKNVLQVKCAYCGKWFRPTISEVYERYRSLEGKQQGEQRLYCSDNCKQECPIFGRISHPKDHKPATSREVQPELRQMRFEIDNYTCQKCGKHQDDLESGLHCHHLEGIRWEPLESADVDKVITLCRNCHKKIHKKEGCKYNDMRCPTSI